MALKAFDGFDHYNSATDLLARSGFLQWQWYSSGGGAPAVTFPPGVSVDGEAIKFQGQSANFSATLTGVLAQRVASGICGARVEALAASVGAPVSSGFAFLFYDSQTGGGPTCQFSVLFNNNSYGVQVYNGTYLNSSFSNGIIGTSANNVWSSNVANMIEIQWTVSASVGAVKVIVNGVTVLNLTNVNTQYNAGGASVADAIGIRGEFIGPVAQYNVLFDDFYYCDLTVGAGTFPCNTPLGDVHVYTRFPTGNNSVQWTPLANTNYQEVNEVAMDGDTSYNSSATVGQEDLLNFSALSTTINNILGVQVTGAYRKDDSAARSIKQAIKSGATEVYGSVNSLPTAYAYFTDLYVLDPATSASWLLAAVNALSAGYNLVS